MDGDGFQDGFSGMFHAGQCSIVANVCQESFSIKHRKQQAEGRNLFAEGNEGRRSVPKNHIDHTAIFSSGLTWRTGMGYGHGHEAMVCLFVFGSAGLGSVSLQVPGAAGLPGGRRLGL